MYKDDEAARANRANTLIDEIAKLEHDKVSHAATEQRLEAAKRELAMLQVQAPEPPPPPVDPKGPGAVTHLLVFGATATAAFLGYTLLI